MVGDNLSCTYVERTARAGCTTSTPTDPDRRRGSYMGTGVTDDHRVGRRLPRPRGLPRLTIRTGVLTFKMSPNFEKVTLARTRRLAPFTARNVYMVKVKGRGRIPRASHRHHRGDRHGRHQQGGTGDRDADKPPAPGPGIRATAWVQEPVEPMTAVSTSGQQWSRSRSMRKWLHQHSREPPSETYSPKNERHGHITSGSR